MTTPHSPRARRDRRSTPALQPLEGRALLAAAVFNPTFGTLHIDLNGLGGNRATISANPAGKVTINGNPAGIVTSTGVKLASLDASKVTFLSVSGTRGADVIDLSDVNATRFPAMAGKPNSADLFGLAGNDTITGSRFNDRIIGADGNDVLRGLEGNDDIEGNLGVDSLFGGAGNDRLNGGNDGLADYLEGGTGSDLFIPEWFVQNRKNKNRDQPVDFYASQGDRVQGT